MKEKKKIGLLGGFFNPVHNGHIRSAETVLKELALDEIHFLPSHSAHGEEKTAWRGELLSPKERLDILQLGLSENPLLKINTCELERKDESYTVDTLKSWSDEDELYFIIGLDQLKNFHKWKSFKELLELSHFVITSREGYEFPKTAEELQIPLREFVKSQKTFKDKACFQTFSLTTGKRFEFVQLEDIPISSKEIRKKLCLGIETKKYLPEKADTFIRENKFFSKPLDVSSENSREFSESCIRFLNEKKAQSIMAYNFGNKEHSFKFSVLCSGGSTRQVSSLAENLLRETKKSFSRAPLYTEGLETGNWAILDYGDVMIHIFYEPIRYQYNLEQLWKEAEKL